MKLLTGTFTNFGSYKELEFDFTDLGLALVFGKTGSGKSTIPDMVAWTLFGQTAKDGSVDEVKSWHTPGNKTIGHLLVELQDSKIIVCRTRGSATQNDLYWLEASSSDDKEHRGKDLNDTQRLLNARLGVDPDLYFAGAYFHEFSSTGTFFVAKAKDRREVFEKIASMDLAVRLGDRASLERKQIKKDLAAAETRNAIAKGGRDSMVRSHGDATSRAAGFYETKRCLLQEYATKSVTFEKVKAEKIEAAKLKVESWDKVQDTKVIKLVSEIKALDAKFKPVNHSLRDLEEELAAAQESRCTKCGGPDSADHAKDLQKMIDKVKKNISEQELIEQKRHMKLNDLEALNDLENPHLFALSEARKEVNTYEERIEEEKKKVNPFKAQVIKLEKDLAEINTEILRTESEITDLEAKISNLTCLYDLSLELRGELLKQAVQDAQDSTNRYLEKYFDSEIRVSFALEGSDDLTVSIQKSGYACSYKQLSRGQRALLRMTFVVSIMKAAANKAGTHFDNLFFDEVLDGMDADLKIKAFGMLEELSTEHESIMVIDHDQGFQNLFTKRFHVTMEGDVSKIEELE
jgi:DNA repair exonuclease SbcCD ATPase subunit